MPTFKEQGLDYKTGTWYGLMAPAKTPPAIIETLHRASVAVLADPACATRIAEQGAEVVASSPAELRAFIKDETERLARVIRAREYSDRLRRMRGRPRAGAVRYDLNSCRGTSSRVLIRVN